MARERFCRRGIGWSGRPMSSYGMARSRTCARSFPRTPTGSARSTPSSRPSRSTCASSPRCAARSDDLVERSTVVDYQDHLAAGGDRARQADRLRPPGAARRRVRGGGVQRRGHPSRQGDRLAAAGALGGDRPGAWGATVRRGRAGGEHARCSAVFQTAGYAVRSGHEYGYVSVSFEITPTAQTRAVQQAREHRAESLSVRGILTPRVRSP